MQTTGSLGLLLQQFFASKKDHIRNKIPSVLSVAEFQHMLNKEKMRADRLSNPFSLVLFALPTGNYCPLCEALVKNLTKLNRVIDEIGFFDETHLAIYLFNTPLNGAKSFLTRISQEFEELSDFEHSISVYPDSLPRPPASNKMANKRLQERLPLLLNAQLSIKQADEMHTISAQTLNISSSGAFIISDRRIDNETEIEFEFSLPLTELESGSSLDIKILAKGHVIRSMGQGFAVTFEPQ